MASEADHVALANRNHDILLHLLCDAARFPEWVATIAFYKAVHVVEAVFAHDRGRHSTSHSDRETWLKTVAYRHIWSNYSHLLNASKVARYLADVQGSPYSSFSDYMSAEVVKTHLLSKRLQRVEQHSLQFLSDAAKKDLKKFDPACLK